jgi:ADP-ribose pyrophosphatase YjhB (NUDIX family)
MNYKLDQQPPSSITNKNTCNNCGKLGHTFHYCKTPITSYGVIIFRKNKKLHNEVEYLMINRKNSFGYIDVVRGKYASNNIEHIQSIINEMSIEEKEKIKTEPFKALWIDMWGTTPKSQFQHRNEEFVAHKKFESVRNGIKLEDSCKTYTWSDLIENSSTSWEEPEWEFPKGRRNHQEKDIECAIREFEEETGIPSSVISVVENVVPFEETFIGTNFKSYKHKYYLAFLNESDISIENYQKTEVSKLQWKTISQCVSSIRPYNLEKKELITKVNKAIQEYSLYSLNI